MEISELFRRCLLHELWSGNMISFKSISGTRVKLQASRSWTLIEQRVHLILRLFSVRRKRMCRLSAQKLRAISTASFLWWLRHQLYSTSARFDFCRAWSCSGFSSCFALDPTLSYTFRKFCWWVVLRQVYQAISFLSKYLTFHRHQILVLYGTGTIVTLTFWREWWWSLRSSRLCVGRRVYRVA